MDVALDPIRASILGTLAEPQFIVVTMVGALLSLFPPNLLPEDVATKRVLKATHIIAAAIVIPLLSRPITTTPVSLRGEAS